MVQHESGNSNITSREHASDETITHKLEIDTYS